MTRFKNVNGEQVPFSAAEELERDAEESAWQLTAVARERALSNAPIIAQINTLESKQHRVMREHALGDSGATAKLQSLNDEIVALRGRLV